MCVDYRQLNSNTVPDSYPLPRIDELLARLQGSRIFSKLDLRDGYHQLQMNKADQFKTAFTCRYGTFHWTVMPFGLSTAPSTFQRVMNVVMWDLLDECVLVYLDDILIFSKTVAEHRVALRKVFQRLRDNKLNLKESKCNLFLDQVAFLGHVINSEGVSVDPGKIDAVAAWPTPQNVTHVQQFVGLCNYYRRFISNFASIAAPLTELTKNKVPFVWGPAQQESFATLLKLM